MSLPKLIVFEAGVHATSVRQDATSRFSTCAIYLTQRFSNLFARGPFIWLAKSIPRKLGFWLNMVSIMWHIPKQSLVLHVRTAGSETLLSTVNRRKTNAKERRKGVFRYWFLNSWQSHSITCSKDGSAIETK